MNIRRFHHGSMLTFLGFMLLSGVLLSPAVGQVTQTQPSKRHPQVGPVSLEHLYWHFLALQSYMDIKAAEQQSQGKDGSSLHSRLQKTLGWSDADYALVRTSSVRLTAEVKGLDAQALTIRATGTPASNSDQLKALTAQREADINAEISYLKQNLSPDKRKTFEAFLTKFFSPANASPVPPKPVGRSQAPAAVQQ